MLTVLVGTWSAFACFVAAMGVHVLSAGKFPVSVWILCMTFLAVLLACPIYLIDWNLRFRRTLRAMGTRLLIESNGIRRRWELQTDRISAFRVVRPWPYSHVQIDYKLLGLGLWSIAVEYSGRRINLVRWVDREAAIAIARSLRGRGFRVDLPFAGDDSSVHADEAAGRQPSGFS